MATELTDAEKEALKLEEEKAKQQPGITDDAFEAEFEKRMGAKPGEFIKKTEILSPEQKLEIEKKEKDEAFSFALSSGYVSADELETYNKAMASDKVETARKKFIAAFPDDKDAGKIFDKMLRLEEPDEFEEDGEKKPNSDKKKMVEFAMKLADEEIDTKFGKKIAAVPSRYKQHIEAQALISANTEIINKVVAAIPKRLEIPVEIKDGEVENFGVNLSAEDVTAVHELLSKEAGKKGLKSEDLSAIATTFLATRNLKKILAENFTIAHAKGVDDEKRGAANLKRKDGDGNGVVSAKRKRLIEKGIINS